MEEHKIIRKIGKSFLALALCTSAWAANVQFSAEVDSTRVNLGDSVTLKLTVRAQSSGPIGNPRFSAPDFDVVGDYSSMSVSSHYDSSTGGFTTENIQQLTKILQPKKIGTLRISEIELHVGSQVLKAPDQVIDVVNSGAPPPQARQNFSNPGFGSPFGRGLRPVPQQKPMKNVGSGVFIRAELDKNSPYYKGEQVIVSYYLYHQMRLLNVQVDKFPVFNGFLREDLEVPVMGQRLDSEPVEVKGVPYYRSLLARYAAYPLQEGKLDLDSISLKFNYYQSPSNSMMDDDDDPFMGFFQQMVPRTWSGKSEPLSIQVLPLPEKGSPQSFSGGVGEFEITSAVDKYQVHANEPITLTVKVDGRGNVSAIQEPHLTWPNSVELYETKGKALPGRHGVSEKVFEFLLIPRTPGQLILPPIEFGFFDSKKKQYYTKTTEKVEIQVLDPAPGTSLIAPRKSTPHVQSGNIKETHKNELRGLKPLNRENKEIHEQPLWRYLYWICLILLGSFGVLIGIDGYKKRKGSQVHSSLRKSLKSKEAWNKIEKMAQSAQNGANWAEINQFYEQLSDAILNAIESSYAIGVKSYSRQQLEEVLVDQKGFPRPEWERLVKLLEYSELVRFASSAGALSESTARSEISKWLIEGRSLLENLEKSSSSMQSVI